MLFRPCPALPAWTTPSLDVTDNCPITLSESEPRYAANYASLKGPRRWLVAKPESAQDANSANARDTTISLALRKWIFMMGFQQISKPLGPISNREWTRINANTEGKPN